uniref:RNase H type-1 domain-containing protein n=1 Tax=Cannabis sativa TaxID=3483 RepID=A0A803Q931_CANSA
MRDHNTSKATHYPGKSRHVSPGFYQLNTDAALSSDQGKLGYGAIIKDWSGRVVAGLFIPATSNFQHLMAEALTLRASLVWCHHIKIPLAFIETDSRILVDRICG